MIEAEYVLPLRWDEATSHREAAALTTYLRWLGTVLDVTVVDGSTPQVFAAHADAWGAQVRHIRPDRPPGPNGKVTGVITGVRRARHEAVVIADDDIRYDLASLYAVVSALEGADVVRPQCVFSPRRWHSDWDTGRILLNRALGHDHPGTHGVRRSSFLATEGYDDRALFENLEMVRTMQAAGHRVHDAPDVFVTRIPPSTSHFGSQRVRQAYDDFAQPLRLLAELSVLPALLVLLRRRPAAAALVPAVVVGIAEVGRRRNGGTRAFAATAAWWAPLWLLERAICVWVALWHRCRGGIPYRGSRLALAAHSTRTLHRRKATSRALPPSKGQVSGCSPVERPPGGSARI